MAKRVNVPEGEYLKGLSDVVGGINNALAALVEHSVQGLQDAAFFVAAEAQQRAPVDTGDLRGSVYVDVGDIQLAIGCEDGNGLDVTGSIPPDAREVAVGFNTPYAADQHEHVEYNHPKGGEAKYLENVLLGEKDRIRALIAGRFER